jgi:hypothetical protein
MSGTRSTLPQSKPIRIADYGHIGREYFATVLPMSIPEAGALVRQEMLVHSTNSPKRVLAMLEEYIPFMIEDINGIMLTRFNRYDCSFSEWIQHRIDKGGWREPIGQYPPVPEMWPIPDPTDWALKLLKHTGKHPRDIVVLLIFKTLSDDCNPDHRAGSNAGQSLRAAIPTAAQKDLPLLQTQNSTS